MFLLQSIGICNQIQQHSTDDKRNNVLSKSVRTVFALSDWHAAFKQSCGIAFAYPLLGFSAVATKVNAGLPGWKDT